MASHTAQRNAEHLAEPLARNGGNARAVEFLSLAGFTLHGNDWIVSLAGELAIDPAEIRNWLSEETPLTMEHEIWPRVFQALDGRREKLTRVHDEIHSAVQAANKNLEEGKDTSKAGEFPVKPLHILR